MSAENKVDFDEIIKKGKYYNPATSHYEAVLNVTCDRCFRKNLQVSIGHNNKDLCMLCVNTLTEKPQLHLSDEESDYDSKELCGMCTSMFSCDGGY